MEDKDIQNIKFLVRNYSLREILSELNVSFKDESNDSYDLGLKEKALECLNASDTLSAFLPYVKL